MSKTVKLAEALEAVLEYGDSLSANDDTFPTEVAAYLTAVRPFFDDRADVTGEADDPVAANAAAIVLAVIDAALEVKS
jgi:hypothetical protein